MLLDENFWRTVVLIVEHGQEWTLGVVLNRQTEADPLGPLPAWADYVARPASLFIGGPVQPEVAVGLARSRDRLAHPSWTAVMRGVGLLDLSLSPLEYGTGIEQVRVFAGYAGWGSGQLTEELEEPSWFVVDGLEDDVFTGRPETLWSDVLRRQRHELALYATFPIDPTAN